MEANRNNAKHSTGPRTDEGKQTSSQNALKHGLLAKRSVIPGEDPAEFDALVTSFENTFNPSNAYEASLVRQMADADWRLKRISHLETAYLSFAVEDTLAQFKKYHPNEPEPDKVNLLGDIMQTRTADMTHFSRYEAHQSRRLHQLFKQLIEIRELDARDRRRFQDQLDRESHENERRQPTQAHRRPPWREEQSAEPTRYGVTSTKPTTSDPPGLATSDESRS
ncbi:MAG: hypothetical protein O2968_08190 [Acidobacteria bacterium]|nr:hypothetical protein [Acidobacteriota bacterium]